MIIHYITNARIPTEKAHGYQIIKMCESFASLKHSVTLVVPSRINSKELKKTDPYDYYESEKNFIIKKIPIPDLIWLAAGLPEKIQYLAFLKYSFIFALASILYCILHKPDLIITRDNRVAYVLSFFYKVIYESHLFPRTWIERYFEKHAYTRAAGYITITRNLKNIYFQHGFTCDKFMVLADGVDLNKFDSKMTKEDARKKIGLPDDSKIIGYMGRFQTLDEEKGIKELIKSIALLHDLKVRAVFVGGPMHLVPEYIKLIEQEGMAKDLFIFIDHVSHREVPLYLKAFDCCAMPFPWTEHYAYFMSPLKMFEYMASKRPLVATRLPSVEEILHEDMAALTEPGDVKELSAALKKILTDENYAVSIAENAFKEVKKYTWFIRAQKIIDRFVINDENK